MALGTDATFPRNYEDLEFEWSDNKETIVVPSHKIIKRNFLMPCQRRKARKMKLVLISVQCSKADMIPE